MLERMKQALKDCKVSVIDLNQDSSSAISSETSTQSDHILGFNMPTFQPQFDNKKKSLKDQIRDAVKRNEQALVILDEQALASSVEGDLHNRAVGYLSRQCIKSLQFLLDLSDQLLFASFPCVLSTFELVSACQPSFHTRKGNISHLSESQLRKDVFCISAVDNDFGQMSV